MGSALAHVVDHVKPSMTTARPSHLLVITLVLVPPWAKSQSNYYEHWSHGLSYHGTPYRPSVCQLREYACHTTVPSDTIESVQIGRWSSLISQVREESLLTS